MKKFFAPVLIICAVLVLVYFSANSYRDYTIMAAGDIGKAKGRQADVADIIHLLNPDKVLTLGDNAYESGTIEEFKKWYDPTWGAFKRKTAPSPGNHEYRTPDATGYFEYFGGLAGPQKRGYYSFDLGAWHLVSLNSDMINEEQLSWLKKDLKATNKPCILAYWHAPLFSSGQEHGSSPAIKVFWDLLYEKGTDVVLNGHEHQYERFKKINPDGMEDAKGIRQFVVGTGGAPGYGFGEILPASEVRKSGIFGALHITLKNGSYSARFESTGLGVVDNVSDSCN